MDQLAKAYDVPERAGVAPNWSKKTRGMSSWIILAALTQKPKTDLTADNIARRSRNHNGHVGQGGVCRKKIRTLVPDNSLKICEIGGICGFNFGI
jgi:hypothetical protein